MDEEMEAGRVSDPLSGVNAELEPETLLLLRPSFLLTFITVKLRPSKLFPIVSSSTVSGYSFSTAAINSSI